MVRQIYCSSILSIPDSNLISGTAILSFFASQAGAKTVYAVDQSEIIYKAMEIAQTNGFKNINFVKGRLEVYKAQ